jgi:hypothetical protein
LITSFIKGFASKIDGTNHKRILLWTAIAVRPDFFQLPLS